MTARTFKRLIWCLNFALMASLIVQFVGPYDFQGLPFLYYGIAVGAVGVAAILTNLRRKPVEKPE